MSFSGLGEIFDFGSKILDKVLPDKTEAAKAKAALVQAQMAGELQEVQAVWDNAKAQAAVNAAEAANSNVWVSGWRPGIGWACGAAFAWSYVVAPMCGFLATLTGHPVALPALNLDAMMPVLIGMLGLGGMRTYEKVKGAAPAAHA